VNDYCNRPIFETWCQYNTQEWKTTQTDEQKGEGHETTWPTPKTGPLDRLRFAADYEVEIDYGEEDPVIWRPGEADSTGSDKWRKTENRDDTLAQYQSWSLGERVTVRRMNLGNVTALVREDETVLTVP